MLKEKNNVDIENLIFNLEDKTKLLKHITEYSINETTETELEIERINKEDLRQYALITKQLAYNNYLINDYLAELTKDIEQLKKYQDIE